MQSSLPASVRSASGRRRPPSRRWFSRPPTAPSRILPRTRAGTTAPPSGGLADYFEAEALIATVERGEVAPLRGSWLIKLHERGGQLRRRQDLPEEAFFTAADLCELIDALGPSSWGLLVVALSYRWLDPRAPDPTGSHLQVVASVARLYLKGIGGERTFGPHNFFSPLIEALEAAGVPRHKWDFGLMWDQCSLHQPPRSPAEEALFECGLHSLPIWYGHRQTVVWMQTEVPEWFTNGLEERRKQGGPPVASSYFESGVTAHGASNPGSAFQPAPTPAMGTQLCWCYFESTLSACLKPSDRRLDIGRVAGADGAQALHAYGSTVTLWPNCHRLDRVCAARRPPPLTPEQMDYALEREKVFSNADAPMVSALYRSFFDAIASAAALSLSFGHLQWCDEAAQLSRALPSLRGLTHLVLIDNALGDSGAISLLASALAECHALIELHLDRNRLGCEGVTHLARALRADRRAKRPSALQTLSLNHRGCFPQIGPHGAHELGLTLSSRGCGLTSLDLSDNKLCGVDFLGSGRYDSRGLVTIASAFVGPTSSLATLSLAGNELCAVPRMKTATSGVAAIATALRRGGGVLTSLDLCFNNLSVEEHVEVKEAASHSKAVVELGDPKFLVSSAGKDTGNFFRGKHSTRNLLASLHTSSML